MNDDATTTKNEEAHSKIYHFLRTQLNEDRNKGINLLKLSKF